MPDGVELTRQGTKLEFEEDDNRRETTLDLGALVAAEAPHLLRDCVTSTKEKMRADGLLADFFFLAGFEVKTYRIAAVVQLLLFTLSFALDISIYLGPEDQQQVWSEAFVIAFVSNCVFLFDSFVRLMLGSSPIAWLALIVVGNCYSEPHFLPANLQRYQASLFGGLCAATLALRFFGEFEAIFALSTYLWVSALCFALAGLCPVFLVYGHLLKKSVFELGTKTRNFLINQSQSICRFSPYFVNVYVETQEAPETPRPW